MIAVEETTEEMVPEHSRLAFKGKIAGSIGRENCLDD